MMNAKTKYLLRSIAHYFDKSICPNCGSDKVRLIKRKMGVTKLVKCATCKLLFRTPIDTIAFNETFYQSAYEQKDFITTQMPTQQELKTLLADKFNQSGKNATRIIELLKSLVPTVERLKIVDYGASWGYISYQLQEAGMDVRSYEISKPRAHYGNQHLGLQIKTSFDEIKNDNQVFFSSHVIEHVPSIQTMLDHAKQSVVKTEDAYFIAYCPNGSEARMELHPKAYHQNWGLTHPNFISDEFYEHIFSSYPYLIDSYPYDSQLLASWDKSSQVKGRMDGDELLVIVKINEH